MMKGLGVNRNRHLSDSCDPTSAAAHHHQQEALYSQKTATLGSTSGGTTLPRSPYLLAPSVVDHHYGTMDQYYPPSHNSNNNPAPGALPAPPDCMLPLNNQLPNSSTFPGLHYNSYDDDGPDFSPPDSIGGIGTGTLGTSMSLGMGMGMGGLRTPMITSGSATISHHHHVSKSQIPQSFLDFDKQLPGGRDGFSTLQFHRSSGIANAKQQRTDSPGRIRYMLHSVQKLFAKTQSLESQQMKGNVNGRSSGSGGSGSGGGGGGGSSSTEDGGKHNRRAKSKDRGTKSDAKPRRPRSNMSGYWSSDDLDSSDVSNYHNHPSLGRPEPGQGRFIIHSGYNTISSSKSSADMKFSAVPVRGGEALLDAGLGVGESDYVKGGSWSTLTMGQPRQVLHKGALTLDRSMLKSKSCQQELSSNYLQVGRRSDWSSSLGRGGAMEIPCRRMRSGSYVKAMGDIDDSDDSDSSPKPSPKSAARRQSYLRATQQSLSDQLPPRNRTVDFGFLHGHDLDVLWSPVHSGASLRHSGVPLLQLGRSMSSCLPSLRELSSNRSLDQLDQLDSLGGTVSSRWDDDDLSQACSTLARRSRMGRLRDLDLSGQYEDQSSESTFRDSRSQSQDTSEPLDLPMPTCFRSRSHSYLRAIQAGCSQDDDCLSLESSSPPPTESSVRTYSSSTDELSAQWTAWKEQFGSYLRATGLDKAPKEKQLAILLQRLEKDRPCIVPTKKTVSTCITTCRKTAPPPVPPRTTSKPYISVTVQSSTESAQDTYLDRDERRSDVTSQSSQAHSNSSDSLDSTRANSLARGISRPPHITAIAREPILPRENREHGRENREQIRENIRELRENRDQIQPRENRDVFPPSTANAATDTSEPGSLQDYTKPGPTKTNLTAEEPLVAPAPRRKLSSIGIQVDCVQEVQVPREETPPLTRFQSIGVQVEDGWQLSRSGSMTSKPETDSDTQEVPPPSLISLSKPSEKKVMVSSASQSVTPPSAQDSLDNGDPCDPSASSPPITRQILNRSTTRSSSSSFSESLDSALDPALDPSCLPPPDPWLESGGVTGGVSGAGGGGGGGTLCRRDGHWFLKLLQAEKGRMEGWCEQMEQETKEHQLSEEVLGKVRSAVGSAQLLMSQKFQQFQGLCEQNLNVNSTPRPTPQDLAGFWDLLQLSIEDISLKFDELYHLKSNDWQPVSAQSPPERKDQEKAAPALKKPGKSRPPLGREKSADATSSSEKQRMEARKRLIAAKKSSSASFRQNSATESADSIEIYVPEAQTRL